MKESYVPIPELNVWRHSAPDPLDRDSVMQEELVGMLKYIHGSFANCEASTDQQRERNVTNYVLKAGTLAKALEGVNVSVFEAFIDLFNVAHNCFGDNRRERFDKFFLYCLRTPALLGDLPSGIHDHEAYTSAKGSAGASRAGSLTKRPCPWSMTTMVPRSITSRIIHGRKRS